MRIAVAQVNPRVGDLSGNMDRMLDYTRRPRQPTPTS